MTKGFRKQHRAIRLQRKSPPKPLTAPLPELSEVEQALMDSAHRVISIVLNDPSIRDFVRLVLHAHDFYWPVHQRLWKCIDAAIATEKPLDFQAIAYDTANYLLYTDETDKQEKAQAIYNYLRACASDAIDSEYLPACLVSLKDNVARLRLRDTAKKIAEMAVNLNLSFAEFMTNFTDEFYIAIEPFPEIKVGRDTDLVEHYRTMHIESLKKLPYADYLKTEHWKRIRTGALDRAKHRCQTCNTSIGLHVHHRTYENRGDEQPEDVTVLCATCHKLFHDNRKVEAA